MTLTDEMRKQMREATRALMRGTASATVQKALKDMPAMPSSLPSFLSSMPDFLRNMPPSMPDAAAGKGFGAPQAVPEFVKNLLDQLGVAGAAPVPAPDLRGSHPAASPAAAREKPAPNDSRRNSEGKGYGDGRNVGQFLNKSFSCQAGTREYKLYIPASYTGQPMPLVVMLHGCTQNPDDFASGTRMNQLAEEKQCFVIYPAQTQAANTSKCWNWFKPQDQQREQGEPAIIAGMTREVISNYQLDGNRVYVAGLSAGGAMAVIMATTYPDLYAAAGVHSGLPYGIATDLPSALSAMRGGAPRNASHAPDPGTRTGPVPIIIFHGDSDTTVNKKNGDRLMKQRVGQHPEVLIEQGQIPGGHRYTCTSQRDSAGQLLAEYWEIHGAGHAWAGGSQSGSYTDPKGPDATREMLRFFYAQSIRGPHA